MCNIITRQQTCDMTCQHSCGMRHSYISHASFICVSWSHTPHSYVSLGPDSFDMVLPVVWLVNTCVTCVTHSCHVTHWYVSLSPESLDVVPCVAQLVNTYVTCLSYTCDVTHSYVFLSPESLDVVPCVAWLFNTYVTCLSRTCDVTHSYDVTHWYVSSCPICVAWTRLARCGAICYMTHQQHLRDMTQSYIWHDSFICVSLALYVSWHTGPDSPVAERYVTWLISVYVTWLNHEWVTSSVSCGPKWHTWMSHVICYMTHQH